MRHSHIQKHVFFYIKKKDIKNENIMCRGSHKSFPIYCILRWKILKRILTYLYFIKANETDVCHLHVQSHSS